MPRLRRLLPLESILEVGAGCSAVAPALTELGLPLRRLTLLDGSAKMLAHSRRWLEGGATLLIGDATATELPSETFDLIVSSLGDPYNGEGFWLEVKRLLRPHGTCLFTLPSPEWASRFRITEDATSAEFVLKDGRSLSMPSLIPDQAAQEKIIRDAGLKIIEIQSLAGAESKRTISPKLRISDDPMFPVLKGYVTRR
jgi:SAM-dependent methyltransferase